PIHVDQSAVSRWENGRTTPDADTVQRLDELLEAGGRLARLVFPAEPIELEPPDEPVTADYVDGLRASIAQLIRLDGQYGGVELVPMAGRMFRAASARLDAGHYPASLESDFTATVAELGEVAGWLAFDAMQHDRARAFNLEALYRARLAGDS